MYVQLWSRLTDVLTELRSLQLDDIELAYLETVILLSHGLSAYVNILDIRYERTIIVFFCILSSFIKQT